jgi:cob(I)alamin adenosyltransferase
MQRLYNKIMTITTKTGDDGKSRWINKVVAKDDILLETIGTIDELQSIIQLVNYELRNKKLDEIVVELYFIMGILSGYGDKKITNLEVEIEEIEKKLKPINKFIVFKKKEAMYLNWARTVGRRVERRVVSLSKKQKIDKNILIFFNRLSDYLFILSREIK